MQDLTVQSNAVNTETEEAIESVCIKVARLDLSINNVALITSP